MNENNKDLDTLNSWEVLTDEEQRALLWRILYEPSTLSEVQLPEADVKLVEPFPDAQQPEREIRFVTWLSPRRE